ncbi:hypothetical protein AOY87_11535 [Escherichia coli]|nr:hypothetical protein AOY87_11535 [Escherichia coli]
MRGKTQKKSGGRIETKEPNFWKNCFITVMNLPQWKIIVRYKKKKCCTKFPVREFVVDAVKDPHYRKRWQRQVLSL